MSYIEFVGPPGSGKTTAARKILSEKPNLLPGRRTLQLSNSGREISRLGLPKGEPTVWLHVAIHMPGNLLLVLKFMRDTGCIRSTRKFAYLVLKAQALASSKRSWVVDQCLHQHLLTALANNRIKIDDAKIWLKRISLASFAPALLIPVTVPKERLRSQIEGSEKHRRQTVGIGVERYAAAMECSFGALFNSSARNRKQ